LCVACNTNTYRYTVECVVFLIVVFVQTHYVDFHAKLWSVTSQTTSAIKAGQTSVVAGKTVALSYVIVLSGKRTNAVAVYDIHRWSTCSTDCGWAAILTIGYDWADLATVPILQIISAAASDASLDSFTLNTVGYEDTARSTHRNSDIKSTVIAVAVGSYKNPVITLRAVSAVE
jgi:hypothetical protein